MNTEEKVEYDKFEFSPQQNAAMMAFGLALGGATIYGFWKLIQAIEGDPIGNFKQNIQHLKEDLLQELREPKP